jgi:hypothetical protein
MFDLNDPRLKNLPGAYRKPYDVSRPLRKIEVDGPTQELWDELWSNLYHQGQIGEASFAAVPFMALLMKRQQTRDWNLYALAGIIELSRNVNSNPDLPDWLSPEYKTGLREIMEMGINDLKMNIDIYTLRSILGFIALSKGSQDTARLLLELDESEIKEILSEYM